LSTFCTKNVSAVLQILQYSADVVLQDAVAVIYATGDKYMYHRLGSIHLPIALALLSLG